jgi:hypothetical protein
MTTETPKPEVAAKPSPRQVSPEFRETIKPADGLELDGLREAVEAFVSAYRKRYLTGFGHVRSNAPMRDEVRELNVALSRKPDLGGGLERSRDLATDVGGGAPKSATADEQ